MATDILLAAIEQCFERENLTRACVVDKVTATDMDNSVLGFPVSFGAGNQIQGLEYTLYQVQDGQFKKKLRNNNKPFTYVLLSQ